MKNFKIQKIKSPFAMTKHINRDIIQLFVILSFSLLFTAIFMPTKFYTRANFTSMAFQFPEFGLLAMGMALAMLTGGTDLSVINTSNLVAIVTGRVILLLSSINQSSSTSNQIVVFSAFLGLIIGALCGALNGFLISKVGISPILTTLGTMQLFSGLGIIITKGTAIYGLPDVLSNLGNGSVFGLIPYPLILFLLVVIIIIIVVQKTKFGYRLYMIGSNPVASSYSGINNSSMIIKTYVLSGMLAGLAGLVILARNNSASADYGSAYLLQTILVSVMAGFSPIGGKGRITNLVVAVITLQVLSSALNMTNMISFFKQFIYGGLLLILVIISTFDLNSVSRKFGEKRLQIRNKKLGEKNVKEN